MMRKPVKKNPDEGDDDSDAHAVERPVSNRFRKGIERNLGCRIGHDNLGVKQTNESDEKTNANGNGPVSV